MCTCSTMLHLYVLVHGHGLHAIGLTRKPGPGISNSKHSLSVLLRLCTLYALSVYITLGDKYRHQKQAKHFVPTKFI